MLGEWKVGHKTCYELRAINFPVYESRRHVGWLHCCKVAMAVRHEQSWRSHTSLFSRRRRHHTALWADKKTQFIPCDLAAQEWYHVTSGSGVLSVRQGEAVVCATERTGEQVCRLSCSAQWRILARSEFLSLPFPLVAMKLRREVTVKLWTPLTITFIQCHLVVFSVV